MPKRTSKREKHRQRRQSIAQIRKQNGALDFVQKLARRKHLPLLSPQSCAVGNLHKVAEVRTHGGMHFIRSCACTGCFPPKVVQDAPVDKLLGCADLAKSWQCMADTKPVQPGDIVCVMALPIEILKKRMMQ